MAFDYYLSSPALGHSQLLVEAISVSVLSNGSEVLGSKDELFISPLRGYVGSQWRTASVLLPNSSRNFAVSHAIATVSGRYSLLML